jgi:hypothetical protein
LHDRLVIRANLFEQESFSGMVDEDESNPCRQAVATKFWQAEIAATNDSQHVHRRRLAPMDRVSLLSPP